MSQKVFIGKRFGKLTVIDIHNNHHFGNSWLCRCDCGNEKVLGESRLIGTKLRRPEKSCGCSYKKQKGKAIKYPRIYGVWQQMINRCYNPDNENYERYGGKGITVCDEWVNSFQVFLNWALNNGYKENLTIDRIDFSKPYEPNNCRWVDYYIQGQNKGISKRNTTGYKGVCHYKDGYRAYITRYGKTVNLGVFKNLNEAAMAREQAEIAMSNVH